MKRIKLRWDVESERRRREREVEIARILANTSANHVMRLLDVGRVGDDLLLVMPLANRSLAAAIKAGDLDKVARVEALRQIAQGLVELAEVPVLHRDLKPANVLDFRGSWQLADFGISRNLLESTDTYTFRGAGTMPYMAPELWAGQPATVKSDLYAFGVLAFEVLTGTRPFTGMDEASLLRQHQIEPPPALPSSLPSTIRRLVLRLLAKDPAARPQDARAVLETFDAAIERLSPQQEALREAALAAQQRRANEDAASATQAARQAAVRQQITQVLADLHEMLEEAADQAREALPDVELSCNGALWKMCWDRTEIVIEVWMQGLSQEAPDDPLVLAGVISEGASPCANIVCQPWEGRPRWSLLRFMVKSAMPPYKYRGPFGFDGCLFALERRYMLRDMAKPDAWRMQRVPLTAHAIVDLLREGIGGT